MNNTIESFDFDAFEFHTVTHSNSLYMILTLMYERLTMKDVLKVDMPTFRQFSSRVQSL